MSLPNVLTYVRIATVPALVACLFFLQGDAGRWSAFALFVFAGFTDWLDGYLARAWEQQSTLGRMLAQRLGCPFIELNRIIEQDYGASIPDLIEMAGIATFRRSERACLERVIAEHEAAVIAAAGGIVSNPETYALLLRRAHTVWIKARPDEHMRRVMEQGDLRPMAQNHEAMADLVAILDARRADYARAQAELDTSGDTAEQSLVKLAQIVARYCDKRG